jgi:ubiquinone/menaquinone biosynthesis C-methylase UbiE
MSPQEFFAHLAGQLLQASQTLTRIPEPEQVTENEGSVNDYNEMMKTNMTANFAVTLDLIHRIRGELPSHGKALDLACGPGHVTISLARHLGYSQVTGLDLSHPMVEAATQNARNQNLDPDRLSFAAGDATDLSGLPTKTFDLVSLTNAAHHFPTIEIVRRVLEQAELVAKPDGLIFISDLARLKTNELTEAFATFAGSGYGPSMQVDFMNSLKAAWLPSELMTAVPLDSRRNWYSVQFGIIPFFQVLVGLPEGRDSLYMREGVNWAQMGFFPNEECAQTWGFMNACLAQGSARLVPTQRQARSGLAA